MFDLSRGGTHSSVQSELFIHNIFSKIGNHFNKFFRADSAYSKHSVYQALKSADVQYTIVLRENIGKYLRKNNTMQWRKTETQFFDSNECEVSTVLYPVKLCGQLRVVMIRCRKSDKEIEQKKQLDLFKKYNPEEDDYRQ